LKVACSITGHQVDTDELGIELGRLKSWDAKVLTNFKTILESYYPCYGAIAQVACFPRNDNTPINDYPWIVDFQPKTRELYEVVTETGQAMSRSVSTVRVGTTGTSTESMQTTDLDKGGSFSIEATVNKIGGKLGSSTAEERGYTAVSGNQNVNVRQIDDSIEKQESLSHTTQLSQMYQLLDSYHLGTNRALFTVFPRPHIIDQDFGDTEWLRRLEGIQEFFLVVEQPRDADGLCVEVQLDTLHVFTSVRDETQGELLYERGSVKNRVRDSTESDVKRTYRIYVPPGTRVDTDHPSGGYTEDVDWGDDQTEDIKSHNVRIEYDHIVIEVNYDPDPVWPFSDTAFFTADYEVFWVSIDPVEEPVDVQVEESTMYITGRLVQNCLEADNDGKYHALPVRRPFAIPPWVVWEEPLPLEYWSVAAGVPTRVNKPGVRLGNLLGRHMKDRAIASVSHPDRYPSGTHSMLDTDFLARHLARARKLPGYRYEMFSDHVSVPDELAERLSPESRSFLKRKSLVTLLNTSSSEIAIWSGLKAKDVAQLKRYNLGVPMDFESEEDKPEAD
ncbi:MAG: hypothetical protein WCE80_14910, partial [Acidimicrobiia bacterium]